MVNRLIPSPYISHPINLCGPNGMWKNARSQKKPWFRVERGGWFLYERGIMTKTQMSWICLPRINLERSTPVSWKIIPINHHKLLVKSTYTGWWFEPLWKILVNGMTIPNIWENKKCSKPPTSISGTALPSGQLAVWGTAIWNSGHRPYLEERRRGKEAARQFAPKRVTLSGSSRSYRKSVFFIGVYLQVNRKPNHHWSS